MASLSHSKSRGSSASLCASCSRTGKGILHLQTQAAIHGQHLPGHVIVRLKKKQNCAGDILWLSKAGNGLLLEKRIVLAAADALFRHARIIDARRNDVD